MHLVREILSPALLVCGPHTYGEGKGVPSVHELAVTQSVVDAVSEHVGTRRVVSVRVEVGTLSGIVADAMRFCFEIASGQTVLEGARLDIDERPGEAHCRDCGSDFTLADLVLLCPCGSADVKVTAGRDLVIKSVEVA
jgi:hydrogenase nickel incorporation protein HypA/HybF